MSGSPRPSALRCVAPVLLLIVAGAFGARPAAGQNLFQQTNLVSDIPGLALFTDPNLVNPWGIAFSATNPFWVANNGTGTSTRYNTFGANQGPAVSIPAPGGGLGSPTGVAFNGTGAFGNILGGPSPTFLFATEEGTIAGWDPSLGSTAALIVDNSGALASYKGITTAGSGAAARLYAANFHAGTIDVWDANLGMLNSGSAFLDPLLPAGYSPFNVQNIGGRIFVTYALKDPNSNDDMPGPGNGLIDVFDLNGSFLQRLVTMGPLNSPWGLALAPTGFGPFGGALLVGNFGNGAINAFDPVSGIFLGALNAANGAPLAIQGLWGLAFGNGGNAGNPNLLYFAAGIPGAGGQLEDHGLFGSLGPVSATVTPEPGALGLVATGLLGLIGARRRRRRI